MNIRDVCLSNVLCDDVPSLSSYRSLSILMFGLAPHPFPPPPLSFTLALPPGRLPPPPLLLLYLLCLTFAISLLVPFSPSPDYTTILDIYPSLSVCACVRCWCDCKGVVVDDFAFEKMNQVITYSSRIRQHFFFLFSLSIP